MKDDHRIAQPSERLHSSLGGPAVERPRVLLAEDDDQMRNLVERALRAEGYDVTTAADGGRLLVRIAATYLGGQVPVAYDLLVSDLQMPICSGLEVLEQLRHAQWRMPAILMTGASDPSIRWRASAVGAQLLIKPFPLPSLLAAVRSLLAPESSPSDADSPAARVEDDADGWRSDPPPHTRP